MTTITITIFTDKNILLHSGLELIDFKNSKSTVLEISENLSILEFKKTVANAIGIDYLFSLKKLYFKEIILVFSFE